MQQLGLGEYSDSQLVAMRDELALIREKSLSRTRYLAIGLGLALILSTNLLPVEIVVVAAPLLVAAAFLMLLPSFRAGTRLADVIREMESRGHVTSAEASHLVRSGAADGELTRRLLVPGIGTLISVVLLLGFVAALVITEAPDGSWLITAAFATFVPLAIFLVWTFVVMAAVARSKR